MGIKIWVEKARKMNVKLKKILLVDDSKFILNMQESVLQKEGFGNIKKAVNGWEAVEIAEEWMPDLIVLDIVMPEMDGFEVCKKIREFSMAPVIFVSGKEDESDKLISFAMGADDYITKPFSPKELVARITVLLKRELYYEMARKNREQENKSYIKFGPYKLDKKREELYKEGELVYLTSKEYSLLRYMLANKNITVSKANIMEHVWGPEYEGNDNTIMVHIRHLRKKIEANPSKPLYIKTIKGRGYRFEL